MKFRNLSFVLLIMTIHFGANGQKADSTSASGKMQWFEDAKLGIFIHYGIYAVNGIPESWSFYNNEISYPDYMKQLDGFTAKNFNAEKWAELFAEAGAKYAVLTSKHHDGVALWNTKLSDLSVVKKTPAARDLISPYATALRKNGLKVGIYFSHLDWSNPDYATVFNGENRKTGNRFDFPEVGKEDYNRWSKFINFRNGQLKEIDQLVKPDLWWFDGDWTRNAEQWKMKDLRDSLLKWNPTSILNARMAGYGDYATPEQGVPIFGSKGPWELCMTINDSWGFQKKDHNQKSVNYIIRTFADCISMGGNLLLDAGPMEDGRTNILKPYMEQHAGYLWGTSMDLLPYQKTGKQSFALYSIFRKMIW